MCGTLPCAARNFLASKVETNDDAIHPQCCVIHTLACAPATHSRLLSPFGKQQALVANGMLSLITLMRYLRLAVTPGSVALTSPPHFLIRHPQRRAFTRIELLACFACVVVLGALAMPALATGQSRSQLAQCLNNLWLIGRAVQMWGMEHGELVPWRVPEADGGTYRPAKAGNAFVEFAWMSNQLATPRILACPADADAIVASEFLGPNGYLTSVNFRQRATSYFVNLHALVDQPLSRVFGDRNLRFDPSPKSCFTASIMPARSTFQVLTLSGRMPFTVLTAT